MSTPKEPLFFIKEEIIDTYKKYHKALKKIYHKLPSTYEDYLKIFHPANRNQICGESSATYLYYYKNSIPKIKKYLGDVKIIILLRNPVEKAFSQYKFLRRMGNINKKESFEETLSRENKRIQSFYSDMYHVKRQGLYYEQVKSFIESFSQVKIFLTEDLETQPDDTLKILCNFLNVADTFNFDFSEKHNVSSFIPNNYFIHNLINKKAGSKIRKILWNITGNEVRDSLRNIYFRKNQAPLELNPETKSYLKDYYRDNILHLQKLINRDLSEWL